jgi:hypothetical protein
VDGNRLPLWARAGMVKRGLGVLALTLLVASLGTGVQAQPPLTEPRWGVTCGGTDHINNDDPILYPGEEGASHTHHFFGNTTTNYLSTYENLLGQDSACNTEGDTAAYWIPELYVDGDPVNAENVITYYRLGAGREPGPGAVEPFPEGLMMISGNSMATQAQPLRIVSWKCGAQGTNVADPETLNCVGTKLFSNVRFQTCWNDVNEYLEGNAHVDYHRISDGACPPGYPTAIPELHIQTRYNLTGDMSLIDIILASGLSKLTLHGDFINAWDQDRLAQLVEDCLNAGVTCPNDPPLP